MSTCPATCFHLCIPSCLGLALGQYKIMGGKLFFLLTIPKCFPLTLSFVLSDFFVVSIGGNDTANHFKMISALGGGISFLYYMDLGMGLFFPTSIIFSMSV